MNNTTTIKFLAAVDKETKKGILQSIAKHYGITEKEAFNEITHHEAEHLLDYLIGGTRLATSLLMRMRGLV